MFAPDADISPYDLPPETAEDDGVPKIVNYANTRLIELEHNVADSRASSAPPSPTRSRVDAAITGTPCKCSLSLYLYTIPNSRLRSSQLAK
jgi:protein DGCR14